MTYCHVDVGPSSDTWCDIIDVEVKVLIDTCLKTEWADDSGIVIFLRSFDVFLGEFEGFVEEGFPECCRVVTAYGVFGEDTIVLELHLLFTREPAESIEG